MKKQRGLVVTFTRGVVSMGAVRYVPGKFKSVNHTLEPTQEACYKWLRKAGLPEIAPGESISLRVKIKRLKAGRPRQQAVAVGG